MRANLSLYLWTRAKPMPCRRDASVRRTVFTRGSNGCSVVGHVSASFVCLKSVVCSGSHTHGVSFRRSCLRWLVRQALSGENAPNCATRPRKERSSFTFSSCLNSRSAANLSSSGRMPPSEMMCPANWMLLPVRSVKALMNEVYVKEVR